MILPTLSTLEEALAIRREIDQLRGRLETLINGGSPVAPEKMPPAVRKKIAAGARRRWKKIRAARRELEKVTAAL